LNWGTEQNWELGMRNAECGKFVPEICDFIVL
jgi:hypothetical protein